jgi:hypothetical protein
VRHNRSYAIPVYLNCNVGVRNEYRHSTASNRRKPCLLPKKGVSD